MPRTSMTLRERASVLATRSKQENCPFHFGFMGALILVMRRFASTNGNLLELAKHTGKLGSHEKNAAPNFFLSRKKRGTCDLAHGCARRRSQMKVRLSLTRSHSAESSGARLRSSPQNRECLRDVLGIPTRAPKNSSQAIDSP